MTGRLRDDTQAWRTVAARQGFAVQQPAGTVPPVLPPLGAQRTHGAPGMPGPFMMGAAQEAMGEWGCKTVLSSQCPGVQLMRETGGGRQREGPRSGDGRGPP